MFLYQTQQERGLAGLSPETEPLQKFLNSFKKLVAVHLKAVGTFACVLFKHLVCNFPGIVRKVGHNSSGADKIVYYAWPELGYVAIDLYTCGDKTNTDKAAQFLKHKLKAEIAEQRELVRSPVREK